MLAIQLRTVFVLTGAGRIERENDPDSSPGPRLWLAGCASGNVVAVRRDVSDGVAAEIIAVAVSEPPFVTCSSRPKYLDRYVELLSREAAVSQQTLGPIYRLPHRLQHSSRHVELIDDRSEKGEKFRELVSRNGMPDGLAELGFLGVSDLWRPWCMSMVNGEVASLCFAARISDVGAELGVVTVKAFRGRDHAAATVAGWSRLPTLQSRELFYSTDESNLSSQRVVARLGLHPLGASLRIS